MNGTLFFKFSFNRNSIRAWLSNFRLLLIFSFTFHELFRFVIDCRAASTHWIQHVHGLYNLPGWMLCFHFRSYWSKFFSKGANVLNRKWKIIISKKPSFKGGYVRRAYSITGMRGNNLRNFYFFCELKARYGVIMIKPFLPLFPLLRWSMHSFQVLYCLTI